MSEIDDAAMHGRVVTCETCPSPCSGAIEGNLPLRDGCFACPIGRFPAWDCERPPEAPLPSLAARVKGFALASAKEAVAVISGTPKATIEEAQRRLKICESNVCGFYRVSDGNCGRCGCDLARKVTWRSAECPARFW